MRRIIALLLLLALPALAVPFPAHADDGEGPPGFRERPQVGQPVQYTDAHGHVFQPERLVVVTAGGARAVPVPPATRHARSEDRVDLSGLPLVGDLFRGRLAPQDAAREGLEIGPVYRADDTLIVDARRYAPDLEWGGVALTARLPRHGTVSYRLGRLPFSSAQPPAEALAGQLGATARRAGTAFLVGRTLVLSASGNGPLIEDLGGAIEDLFE